MTRAAVLLTLLAAFAAHGRAPDDARAAALRGEAAYAAGRYDEALTEFERAAAALPEPPPELLHNQAAALFKLGRLGEARALWDRIRTRKDAAFEARTTYNLGNVDYAEALAHAQPQGDAPPDLEAAKERLTAAAERYRAALRLDPTLADARANLELTELLRRQLAQAAPQTQPGRKDRRSDSQPSSQPTTQPSSPPDRSQSSSQPSDSPDSSESRDSSEAQDQPSTDRDSQRQPPDADRDQKPADEQSEPPTPPQSQDPRDQSREHPERDAAETRPAESQPAEPQPEAGTPRPAGVKLTREQAERLLQKIREAEKARREALARQRDARRPPVDRDW